MKGASRVVMGREMDNLIQEISLVLSQHLRVRIWLTKHCCSSPGLQQCYATAKFQNNGEAKDKQIYC